MRCDHLLGFGRVGTNAPSTLNKGGLEMSNETILDTCVEVSKKGRGLNELGVISIDFQDGDVHLRGDGDFFKALPGDATEELFNLDYPYKYTKRYRDVSFFYLTDKRRA